jgi:hypothetical protein
MLKRLPWWATMRYDSTGAGSRFLDGISHALDAMSEEVGEVGKDIHLDTIPANRIAWVYRVPVSPAAHDENLEVYNGSTRLEEVGELSLFLRAWPDDLLHDYSIYYGDPWYYDQEQQLVYMRKTYDVNELQPEGHVQLVYRKADGTTRQIDIAAESHHVWNAFDEFGLMTGRFRQRLESNASLRERIWDRSRLPNGLNATGIASRLVQVFGSIREVTWVDRSLDLLVPEPLVDPQLVLIDGKPISENQYRIDSGGRVVIIADAQEGSAVIRYGCGLIIKQAGVDDIESFRGEVSGTIPTWSQVKLGHTYWASLHNSARVPVNYDTDPTSWNLIVHSF